MNASDLQWLHSNCCMIRWICGAKNWYETPMASLLLKLRIVDITAVFPASGSDCLDMYSVQYLSSNMSPTYELPIGLWDDWS